ncbi:uncharacterized protein LOC131321294 [Rhododendron vialii]|uniref:uncharacterized protein LOC131321294 n=1 Tax=Rhododendron vialii TaxID=182163 RepID=UPI00265EE17E|nr:uncharacterized protein LOC131321294 [Rhododendron vialii]
MREKKGERGGEEDDDQTNTITATTTGDLPSTAATSGNFCLHDFQRDHTPPRCWNWLKNAARDNKKTRIMPQPIHVVAITVNILMMLQTSSSVDADDDEDEDEEETGSEEEEEAGSMRTMIVRVVIVVIFIFIFIFCSQLKGEDKCNAHIMVFVSGRLCITLIILVNARVCSIYFLLLSWFSEDNVWFSLLFQNFKLECA